MTSQQAKAPESVFAALRSGALGGAATQCHFFFEAAFLGAAFFAADFGALFFVSVFLTAIAVSSLQDILV